MCNRNPVEFEDVKNLIIDKIPDAEVILENKPHETHHLQLLIISDEFKNKRILQQHQLVMDSLKEKFSDDLHAVQLKTLTKEKYQEQKGI